MKVAIIGGGFYGCYLAFKLKKHFKSKIEINIFEKNKKLLDGASNNSQWRLHLGFHYPRSEETVNQCVKGSKKFKKDFKRFIFYPKNNLYLIHKNSKTKFKKFVEIYKKFNLSVERFDLKKINYLKNIKNFSGSIKTKEGVIRFDKLNPFLRKKIKDNCKIYYNKNIKKINSFSGDIIDNNQKIYKNYDYILNCTYTEPNIGNNKKFSVKYELAGMVETKNPFKERMAITIMDGPFISIYPRKNNTVSFSSVKYTPIKKMNSLKYVNIIKKKILKEKKKYSIKIIDDIKKYFNFNFNIKIIKLILAIKVKVKKDFKDQRPTIVSKNFRTFNILCGKIDAAPLIFDKIIKKIKNQN